MKGVHIQLHKCRWHVASRNYSPLRKSHMLPTCEPRVFYRGTHVFHIKAHIFHLFSPNVTNCPMRSTCIPQNSTVDSCVSQNST